MQIPNRLIIRQTDFDALTRHLQSSRDERMAFLYCGRAATPERIDWLVRELDLPRDDEYRRQGPARVTLTSEAAFGRVRRARSRTGFIDVHSHPFTEHPWPSALDDDGASRQRTVLEDLAPQTSLIRLIFGKSGNVFGQVRDNVRDSWVPLAEVLVLGRSARRSIRPVNTPGEESDAPCDLDKRTRTVVGARAAELRKSRTLVIGAGGVGAAVLTQLAGLVGRLDVVDPDTIEPHNLPRLFYAGESDVGSYKVQVAERALGSRLGRLEVRGHVGAFPDDVSKQWFGEADFVFCCPDHHAVRWAAASLASMNMKPLVEVGCGGRRGTSGTIDALGYHVRLQVPAGPCLACNGLDLARLEDPTSTETKKRAGYVDGDNTIRGELVTLTTRAAADAVETFVRYMTGYAGNAPGHLYFDALGSKAMDLSGGYQSDPGCSLCGEGEHCVRGIGDLPAEEHRILSPDGEVHHAVA